MTEERRISLWKSTITLSLLLSRLPFCLQFECLNSKTAVCSERSELEQIFYFDINFLIENAFFSGTNCGHCARFLQDKIMHLKTYFRLCYFSDPFLCIEIVITGRDAKCFKSDRLSRFVKLASCQQTEKDFDTFKISNAFA